MTRIGSETPRDGVLRVGVLGPGAMAQAVHLPLLARRPEQFRIVARALLEGCEARALGRAGARRLGRLYSDVLLGSIVPELAMIRALAGCQQIAARLARGAGIVIDGEGGDVGEADDRGDVVDGGKVAATR